MITAANCEAASELLAERAEIAEQIARIKSTSMVRVEYQYTYAVDPLPDYAPAPKGQREPTATAWATGPEMKPTPSLMKLLLGSIEECLADIDARLCALGVEPPPAEAVERVI